MVDAVFVDMTIRISTTTIDTRLNGALPRFVNPSNDWLHANTAGMVESRCEGGRKTVIRRQDGNRAGPPASCSPWLRDSDVERPVGRLEPQPGQMDVECLAEEP